MPVVGCLPCLRRRGVPQRVAPHERPAAPDAAEPAAEVHAPFTRHAPPVVDTGSPVSSQRRPTSYGSEGLPSTTRSQAAMAETPSGAAANVYRFYCPLCMLYFKSISRMSCCQQYICTFCVTDYVARQGVKLAPADDDGQPATLPAGLSCPCCSMAGLDLRVEKVDASEEARSYLDSPRTRANMPPIRESLLSPLRIGESFDAMLRKMLTFEAVGYRASSAARHEALEGPPAEEEGVPLAVQTPRPPPRMSLPDPAPPGVARADGRVAPVQSPAAVRAGVAPPPPPPQSGADRPRGSVAGARPPMGLDADVGAPASDE